MGVPGFGENTQWSPTGILLADALAGMGDYLTQEVGSLAWIEARVMSQLMESAFNMLQLMSEQIQPASSSVFLDRWAQIYNIQGLSQTAAIVQRLQLLQSLTGTPPTLTNVTQFMQDVLGNIFLQITWTPENQYLATVNAYQDLIVDGYSYSQPLAVLQPYVWQPRDNQDNLLMPTNQFMQLVDTYIPILQNWTPHYTEIITMNLTNRGCNDGYGDGYYGPNFNNYLDGYNVVSGTAGSAILTGVGTTFTQDFFPQAGSAVLPFSPMRAPPIQIVDDTNTVQTYYVDSVISNTQMLLTSDLFNNITSRTYRTLGFMFDVGDMFDDGGLFNN